MPMECLRCNYVSDDLEMQVCPECGSRLRLSLLRAHMGKNEGSVKVTQTSNDVGFGGRFQLWFLGMVVMGSLAGLFAFLFLILVQVMGMDINTLSADEPGYYYAGSFGIPLLALAITVVICLHKVYLAQLVAATLGLTGSLMILGVRTFLGFDGPPWEWMALPLLAAMVGFMFGLKTAGELEITEHIEVEDKDAWDPSSQSITEEIAGTPFLRWMRILTATFVAQRILAQVLGWLMFLVPKFDPSAEVDTVFYFSSILLGGVIASYEVRWAVLAGFLSGMVYAFLNYLAEAIRLWDMPLDEEIILTTFFSVIFSTLGGYMSKKLFPPPKIHRGIHDRRHEIAPE